MKKFSTHIFKRLLDHLVEMKDLVPTSHVSEHRSCCIIEESNGMNRSLEVSNFQLSKFTESACARSCLAKVA